MPKPVKGVVAKPKNMKAAFTRFAKSLKEWRFRIIIALVIAMISAVLGIFTPKILGNITTEAVQGLMTNGAIDWGTVGGLALLAILLFVVSGILGYLQSIILAKATVLYTKGLRTKILEKINRLPVSYFDQHQYGDVLSRMSNDVDVLATSLSQQLSSIITNLTTVVGVMIMMLTISWWLSLLVLIMVPLSVFCVGKIAKFSQKFFRKQQATLGDLNSRIEEDYSGQLIIKSNSYEPTALEQFCEKNNTLADTSWKAQFFSSLAFPVTHMFTNLGYVAVCIAGGYGVVNASILIGDVQAFLQYVMRFNNPITEIASTTSTIQLMLAAAERIFDFLEETEEVPDDEESLVLENVKGAVEFHDVCFSYDKKKPIIQHFSAKIKPGQQVAIVGPTGAGKTTIINLLMRFYDPDSGYISIDDVPTKEMRRADVRQMFGMVLQDTWLFSGTIKENLSYGKVGATKEEVLKAAKTSNVHHFVESLPHAYKTQISEDSDNISAGEKQLLTIARAIVANPPMMILDEATSNVDTRTEQLIQDAFEKLTKGRTSFVIAHRLSTIRNADLILVMKDGNIIEQGNHDELLAKNGFYADLYNSQFVED